MGSSVRLIRMVDLASGHFLTIITLAPLASLRAGLVQQRRSILIFSCLTPIALSHTAGKTL